MSISEDGGPCYISLKDLGKNPIIVSFYSICF
jgi:hypothetical protein